MSIHPNLKLSTNTKVEEVHGDLLDLKSLVVKERVKKAPMR